MSYSLGMSKRAASEFARLPQEIISRLDKAILGLTDEPRPSGSKKLKGAFSGGYRVQVGDYRILYLIDDAHQTVTIYRVGHRRDVYE